jgi:hypothetical protein
MQNSENPTGANQEILSPAQRVISAFGGVRATARAVGRNQSSVSRWVKPSEMGGLSGRVPSAVQETVLLASRRLGLGLTAEDLIVRSVG